MKRQERAQLAWQVLAGAAYHRQTLTYDLLAKAIGMGAGTMNGVLGCIMYYCEQHNLPPLTALVVNKATGLPGHGLKTPTDLHAQREEVFRWPWHRQLPPTADDLSAALEEGT